MVRLNTTYAPNGNFSVYSDLPVLTKTGEESRIGYDAAVCVELYEPYIVETYNSTVGLPSSTGIISKGGKIIDVDAENIQEKNTGATVSGQLIRELNSTNLSDVYGVLHGNSVNQIIKVRWMLLRVPSQVLTNDTLKRTTAVMLSTSLLPL